MAKKEFKYRGKTLEELQELSIKEFAELVPARQRRSLKRGLTDQQKILLNKLRKGEKNPKTHCRGMIIVHDGKSFIAIRIVDEMIGYSLGEFTYNRKRVSHSAPGIGATRSSASLSVK